MAWIKIIMEIIQILSLLYIVNAYLIWLWTVKYNFNQNNADIIIL